MNKQEYEAWLNFLGGKWTKERPTTPGTYPIATKDGRDAGTLTLKLDMGRLKHQGPSWHGWWWTREIPELPRPPLWEGRSRRYQIGTVEEEDANYVHPGSGKLLNSTPVKKS